MAEVNTLISGLVFGESPRWHDNHVYIFDIATNEVFAVLSVESSVNSRVSHGGTAPRNVRREAKKWLDSLRERRR